MSTAIVLNTEAKLGAMPEALHRQLPALLEQRAPYLETKLIRLGVAADRGEAHALFQEVKKYLALSACFPGRELPMISVRVDEVWHQFVLFTRFYASFCQRFFGHFMQHNPAEASEGQAPANTGSAVSVELFRSAYEAHFGALSTLWFDEQTLSDATALAWKPWTLPMAARIEGEHALLVHVVHAGQDEQILCKASRRALPALQFIAQHRFFFVRELPGLADSAERVSLCRPLVQFKVLSLSV